MEPKTWTAWFKCLECYTVFSGEVPLGTRVNTDKNLTTDYLPDICPNCRCTKYYKQIPPPKEVDE